jgi:thiol-disulfide isomerase/thioredoxin
MLSSSNLNRYIFGSVKHHITTIGLLLVLVMPFSIHAQQIKTYAHFEDLEPLFQKENDTTYLINFWATWCKPCIEEMPAFQAINKKFRGQKFKMILVSLDFETQVESRLKPYIRENEIEAEVLLLTDSKTHIWIDKVNPEWSGSIPFTRIYNKDFDFSREGELTYEELDKLITQNIKK